MEISEEQKVVPYKNSKTRKASPSETIAKASDPKATKSSSQFVAVMRGEYWAQRAPTEQAVLKPYEAAFLLNAAQAKIAISYIRAYLLTDKLKAKYNDVNRVYTHHLVALHPKSDPTSYVGIPYHWMGLAQIARLINDQDIPVDPSAISDLHELRQLVRVWCENPVDKTIFNQALERAKKNLRRTLKGLGDDDLAPENQSPEDDFDEEAAIRSAGIGSIKLDANVSL